MQFEDIRLQSDLTLFRPPTVADAAAVHALVVDSGVLELNSCYAYLLLCTHFADTCLLAERAGECVGFVSAYRPPVRPEALFVWQIGVREAARCEGLARRLLLELLRRPACKGVRFLEATVAESNVPSQRLFRSVARERATSCEVTVGFKRKDFGALAHEDEPLYRIGPLGNSL